MPNAPNATPWATCDYEPSFAAECFTFFYENALAHSGAQSNLMNLASSHTVAEISSVLQVSSAQQQAAAAAAALPDPFVLTHLLPSC